ncbi:putative F-box domain-containing protein [Medicago truncatula]|uniref:Putative F-box domain-containing protein n=1 Tax=Medicago truncatula TaxID=3880 RepID=A0A396IYG9_MEDTR|nr:putative F-box domain-containing protein [Medicago truncatula]
MMQQSATFIKTLTSPSLYTPPLPTLPFDLVAEILCRLPVKLLLQLRCLCKSLNSLILDPKFAKKHLRMSTTHHNLMPDDSVKNLKTLGVVRDYLCIFANSEMCLDIWIMKEYGNKESWTKLYSVPYVENWGLYAFTKALYISDEDQVLMDLHELGSIELKVGVYDFKNGILKILEIQNSNHLMDPKVYIESLSPCS